jgi:hypothetical protein
MTSVPASSASPLSSAAFDVDDASAVQRDEVVVATFDALALAELVRGRLEASGIAARLVDAHTVSVASHLAQALGGVKVVVGKDDVDDARELLASPSAFTDTDAEVDVFDDGVTEGAADALARRAVGWACVGLALPVVGQVASLACVVQAHRLSTPLTRMGQRNGRLAVAIDAVVLAVVAAIAYTA